MNMSSITHQWIRLDLLFRLFGYSSARELDRIPQMVMLPLVLDTLSFLDPDSCSAVIRIFCAPVDLPLLVCLFGVLMVEGEL
jgi:hypothetical protein